MKRCALCWDDVANGQALVGTAWGITGTICKECVEYVGNEDFKESLVPATKTYSYSSVEDWNWSQYNDIWDDPIGTYGGTTKAVPYVLCHHHLVPFMFQGMDDAYTVYLTGSSSLRQEPATDKLPTVGVYLDEGWMRGRLATNTAHDVDMTQPSCIYIGWPDYGVIDAKLLAEAVEWVLPYVHNKQSVVEIACMGGHGRTGTFVGALLIREGWAPADAIAYIHGGYCNKAIETKTQEELLTQYQHILLGVNDESTSPQLHQA
jgi:hypothetical protein